MTSKKEQFYIQRISELEAQLKQRDEHISELLKINAELAEKVAKLTDKVAKLSKNSSKPPSSDSQASAKYGQKLLDAMRDMFSIFHKTEELTEKAFAEAMDESRKTFLDIALSNVPESRQAQNLANRFREHGEAYFRFITTPGVEPTNNVAEQAMRFVVIDRYITQSTRSEKGRAWCERIWTVPATCASQDRSAFDFMYQSIQAHFSGQPLPSLLGP